MGAAILVTLGVLWLLHNYWVVRFGESFPILFLVGGGVLLISRTGSTEGHVQPGWIQGPTAPSPTQQEWTSGVVPPPPQQGGSGAGNPPSSSDLSEPNDSQVKP
jgi:hypothetical protein